jgi:uncharacterized spore protein YtfJ
MKTALPGGSAVANDLLERLGQAIGGRAKASTVFGEPVDREGITVIPVARMRFAFGGGGGGGTRGGDDGSGGGGGGAAIVKPVGYIEVRQGSAQFRRISGASDLLALAVSASLAALTVRRLFAG